MQQRRVALIESQNGPVEVAAKSGADSEEVLERVGAIGATVYDDTPSSCRACMTVTGRGLRPNATHAVPTERCRVQQIQVIVKSALRPCTCFQAVPVLIKREVGARLMQDHGYESNLFPHDVAF